MPQPQPGQVGSLGDRETQVAGPPGHATWNQRRDYFVRVTVISNGIRQLPMWQLPPTYAVS